jgi:hypothetical protein
MAANQIFNQLDADQIIEGVKQELKDLYNSRIELKSLCIWGGEFAEADLENFLLEWQKHNSYFTWRMWELVSRFDLDKSQDALQPLNGKLEGVERGRFFGMNGDLMVRRDGHKFFWRFIGDSSITWPGLKGKYGFADYAESHPKKCDHFYRREVPYYQWHEKERRVTDHWLVQNKLPSRQSYLVQHHYMREGRIEFVRYVDLKP